MVITKMSKEDESKREKNQLIVVASQCSSGNTSESINVGCVEKILKQQLKVKA